MTTAKKPIFLTPYEVQEIFKISQPTELAWRKAGILPRPITLGKRIFYRTEQIINIGETQNQN